MNLLWMQYQLLGNADVIVEYLASKLGYNLDSKEDPGACLPGTEKKRKRKKVFKRRQYGEFVSRFFFLIWFLMNYYSYTHK